MGAGETRCAVWYGRGDVRLERQAVPELGPGDVLVRIAGCGLCATDLHLIDGSIPLYQPPHALGHEAAGVVEEVGSAVRSLRPGDGVALDTSVPCDVCFYCREARPFLCGDRRPVFGYLADFAVVPERVAYRLPPALPLEHGALAEPLSCVLHALGLTPLAPGVSAAVVGAGAIGLLLTQMLRRAGVVELIVSDPDPARRELASAMGATHVVDPRAEDVAEAARRATDGIGVDLTFEAVGSAATVQAALALPRRGGTVVLVGVAPADARVTFSPYDVFARELTIRGSAMRAYEFARAVKLLPSLDLAPLIPLHIPLDRIHEALELSRERAAPKVLVCP